MGRHWNVGLSHGLKSCIWTASLSRRKSLERYSALNNVEFEVKFVVKGIRALGLLKKLTITFGYVSLLGT